jgi:hypothetical protein
MPTYARPTDGVTLSAPALRAWTEALIQAAGTPPDVARDVGEVLLVLRAAQFDEGLAGLFGDEL